MRIQNVTWHATFGWVLVFAAVTVQATTARAFVYQGQIKLDGQPLTGTADMLFTLWDDEVAGRIIGNPHLATNVDVVNGLFAIEVDLGASALAIFDGTERWLQTQVRSPAGSGTFTTLEPRQKLSATPYALYARRAEAVPGIDGHSLDAADSGPVDALYVNSQGHVGIGLQNPTTLLGLSANGTTPVGITQNQLAGGASMELTTSDGNDDQATRFLMRGSIHNPDIEFYRGARGAEQLTMMIDGATGRVGIGESNPQTPLAINSAGGQSVGITQNQVAGASSMEFTTSDGAGNQATRLILRGESDEGDVEFYRGGRGAEQRTMIIDGNTGHVGIGTSAPDHPLHVKTSAARAIHGAVTSTTGLSNAVFGHNMSDEGRGVFGHASSNSGVTFGGSFQADSTNGTGVRGFAGADSGITNGVSGLVSSPDGRGVFGHATNVFGGNFGGLFQSDGQNGVGVRGFAGATSVFATGVEGRAPSGVGVAGYGYKDGVYGRSESLGGAGVHGSGEYYGGYFESTTNTFASAVRAVTPNGTAVWAEATNPTGWSVGVSGDAYGDDGIGVSGNAESPTGHTRGVDGRTQSPDGYGVYSYGHLGASGVKYFIQPHPTDPSKEIRFISLEGNEPGTYFRGTATLINGRAVIEVPSEFRLVSEQDGLTVQLTPRAPDAGMWVESSNLDRIVIRGNGNARFDYFVNGVRRGFAGLKPVQENYSFAPTVRGVPFTTPYSEDIQRMLVENGILNEDLTPNERTAARLGWTLRDPTPKELTRAEAWREAHRQRSEIDAVQTRSP